MEIKFSELNIIETYVLMISRGNSYSNYTGKLSYLKPASISEGFRMITERFYKPSGKLTNKDVPKEFELLQNYPNPFNPVTKIQYNLPGNSRVVITIYDILGRKVKELVNEKKDAGTYYVLFDGSNFASGVYFYKIEAGSFIETKKMVLIK